jgi:GPI mannosyltransferase 3
MVGLWQKDSPMEHSSASLSKSIRRLFFFCGWLSLLLFIATAIFSSGFHHYDEHYSILEFANYKLGKTPGAALPWEFRDKIRPWLQPAALWEIFQVSSRLGVEDPFVWAATSRILSALFGWMALWSLLWVTLSWITGDLLKKVAIWTTTLLWFLPYLSARTSSESWGGSFFFLGLALLLSKTRILDARPRCALEPLRAFCVGLLWGLAFEFRFQVVLMCLGAGLWCLAVGRISFRSAVAILSGYALIVVVSIGVDTWGYGQFTFSAWNYFRENIINGKAASFGVSPWYAYFRLLLLQTIPPLSVLLLFLPAVAVIRFPLNPLVWTILPFFVGHVFLGHKELRFLFPMAAALPTLIALGLQTFRGLGADRGRKIIWNPFTKFLTGLNTVLLIVCVFRPVRFEIPFYEHVYRAAMASHWKDVYYVGENPYELVSVSGYFYRPKDTEIKEVAGVGDLLEKVRHPDSSVGVVWRGPEIEMPPDCEVIYKTIPPWLHSTWTDPLLQKTGALDWTLFQCASPTHVGE